MDYLHEIGIPRWQIRRTTTGKRESEPNTLADEKSFIAEESSTLPEQPSRNDMEKSLAAVESETNQSAVAEKTRQPSWQDLVEQLESHTCPCCSASNPILGEGNIDANWVFVIDAPSQRDIESQQLLSGRVGQLFDAVLSAMELTRDDIYLMSIFKCPPADDIAISPQCGDLVLAQLELLKAENVIMLGEFVAQKMLRRNEALPALRELSPIARESKQFASSYSLQQILTAPELKASLWADLSAVMSNSTSAD